MISVGVKKVFMMMSVQVGINTEEAMEEGLGVAERVYVV